MPEEFDPLRYIASYSDLIQVYGADPVAGRWHWVHFGQAEGRDPFRFNPFFYGASNPDLIPLFGSYYTAYTDHYIRHGFAAGRSTSSFDYLGYSASNSDLLVVFGTNASALAQHYIDFGYNEGRSFSRLDAYLYGASNPDVAAAVGDDRAQLLGHYINYGFYEGRPTTGFDATQYVAANKDLLLAGYQNYPNEALHHYLQTGADEGRPTDFDERAYLLTYADLAGNHLSEGGALHHWIDSGVHEGRAGDTLFGHDQTSHALPAGGTAVAAIDFANDRDWFELNLAEGSFHSLLTTHVDGSVRPATITLHDQYGVPIASKTVQTGDVSGLDFTASYGGRYFVVVASAQTGAYRLSESENATGTMTIGGRDYTDADFAGLHGIRYLELTDHHSVQLGPNAQAAGIRVVTATSNLASIIDASAYTTGLTVDVSAGGGDTVKTGSGNDQVIAGAGAQNISLGAGDDLVTGAVSTAHTISGGDGTDTIRLTGNVTLDLSKFSGIERIEQGAGKLWLRLTTSGPTADAAYTIVGNGSYEYNLVWLELELTQPNIDFTILAAPGGTQFWKANSTANTLNFVGGASRDVVQISVANLGPDGSIDGGGGVDWYVTSDLSLVDAHFERVHNMEILNQAPDDLTLGHFAAASGLTTIVLETSRTKNIIFQPDYTGAVEVTMTQRAFFDRETGDDASHVIDASLSPVQLTVSAWASEIQSGDIIRGGTGSLDVLNIDYPIFSRPTVGTIDPTPLDLANVTGIETINVTVTGDSLNPQTHGWVFIDTAPGDLDGTTVQTINVVGARGNPEDLLTAPIDASLATADLVINGAYRVKSGSGNDTITGSEMWRSILEGGAGNDAIEGGTLADQLFGGIGNDILRGAAGSDAIDLGTGADRVLYGSFGDTAGGAVDTVAGFTSGDDVVDVTGLADAGYAGQTIDFLGNAATLAAAQALLTPGDSSFDAVFQQDTHTLWFDNGDGVLDSNDLQIVLTGVGSLTGADVLEGSVIIG